MRSNLPPDILLGRRVRRVEVQIAPESTIGVLEAADADVVLEESIRSDGDAYAAVLRPGAIAAAVRLTELVMPGMRVVDVGTGTGVAALAAASLGGVVVALVHDEFAHAVVAGAAELEGLDVAVRIWDTAGDEPLPSADLAVFAEALYEPGLARAAADRTVQALAGGSRVLVTDPGRYARAEYERVLGAAGVHVDFEDAVVRVPGEAQPARVGIAMLEPAAGTP